MIQRKGISPVLTLLILSVVCVFTVVCRLTINHSPASSIFFRGDSWLLFPVGALLAVPLLFWVVPRVSKGFMKHILRGLVCLLFIGPTMSPPDGVYLPFLATFWFYPFFYLSGYGLLSAIDAYLILVAAFSASLAWEVRRKQE